MRLRVWGDIHRFVTYDAVEPNAIFFFCFSFSRVISVPIGTLDLTLIIHYYCGSRLVARAQLIEVSTEKSGKGRPSQLVSLTNRGYEILQKIVDLSGLPQTMEQLPTHPNIALLYECLTYLESPESSVLKKLAADEFQLMSQKYFIPLESQFFEYIEKILTDEASNGVLHTRP